MTIVTRTVEGDRTTSESDRLLEITHHEGDDGWDRGLVVQVWLDTKPQPDGCIDLVNISCSVYRPEDDEFESQEAGINLTRDQTRMLRDFLDRALDPDEVERKFHELKQKLQHEHDTKVK